MEKIGLKYGLLVAVALIVYFLLMRLIGVEDTIELRFLNAVIMAIGVVMAIKAYKTVRNGDIQYFKGIGTGVLTAVVATVIFAVFMLIYIKAFDDRLLEVLTAESLFGERMTITPGVVVFIVLMLEGVISGFFISFIAMQWFKKPQHKVPNSP
ncbi:DUF4199 domain-containing protein [Pontibacter sp. SGAir0037]|uniref:DUF4199 domain-containing protein n=1 Tax=Pontibacter sp. SGAir0037 TaxID=2571030 RepID=UPI0010CD307A|nr:DUF4199 domain-containing protein [Pontibacter sp. SGAir0037]QCR21667.1 hypothetical protein C1N53_04450 [Pontibacter sp. SGAir0037]